MGGSVVYASMSIHSRRALGLVGITGLVLVCSMALGAQTRAGHRRSGRSSRGAPLVHRQRRRRGARGLRACRNRQQPRLGVPASGVHRARLPRDHLRPARISDRSVADPSGRAARHRRRRSQRADGPPEDRSVPSGRHSGRRLRRLGLRAVVSPRLRSLVVAQQHRRCSGPGVPGDAAAAENTRFPGDESRHARTGTVLSCVESRGRRSDGGNWSAPRGRPAHSRRPRPFGIA